MVDRQFVFYGMEYTNIASGVGSATGLAVGSEGMGHRLPVLSDYVKVTHDRIFKKI
jgi:hypothetical protein